MYWIYSNLVCIYVGFYIKEFAEDGAETQNATAVSPPRPQQWHHKVACMPHVTRRVCGSLPVVIVGTVRYLPTICFDRPALDANATQLHVLYVLRRYGIVWYNRNHVATQN